MSAMPHMRAEVELREGADFAKLRGELARIGVTLEVEGDKAFATAPAFILYEAEKRKHFRMKKGTLARAQTRAG